ESPHRSGRTRRGACLRATRAAGDVDAIQRGLVEIDRACGLRLADQIEIEVWAIPVRVADLVVRACGDHQLPLVRVVIRERFAGPMKIESEAALQAAGDLWPRALPRAPFGEHANLRQFVRVGQF